jgi:hypothetical protein
MRGQFSELTETLGSGSGRLLKPLPKEPRKQPPVLEPPQPCGSAAVLTVTDGIRHRAVQPSDVLATRHVFRKKLEHLRNWLKREGTPAAPDELR